MDNRLLSDLEELKESFLTMGALVERNLKDSVLALVGCSSELATEVSKRDDQVDLLEIQIDKQCLEFVALRGPMAGDLRFVATSLKAVKDLERIGDIAKHVAKLTVKILKEPGPVELLEIPQMAEAAQKMLSTAMEAFVNRDVEQARQVIETDDVLDHLLKGIFKSLVNAIAVGDLQIDQGFLLLSIAKYLERAGDHSCNISKMVIFMVEGKDVRHASKVAGSSPTT
jgi:phosphate transport system protein